MLALPSHSWRKSAASIAFCKGPYIVLALRMIFCKRILHVLVNVAKDDAYMD